MATTTKTRYGLIRIDTANYGYIVSAHRSRETADMAMERKSAAVLRREPNAITGCMYRVSEIGPEARVGQRVRA